MVRAALPSLLGGLRSRPISGEAYLSRKSGLGEPQTNRETKVSLYCLQEMGEMGSDVSEDWGISW